MEAWDWESEFWRPYPGDPAMCGREATCGSRSRIETQLCPSLCDLAGHNSFWDSLSFKLWHSGQRCAAQQAKEPSPIPPCGKVLSTFTSAQPCLHGWLLFDREKELSFPLAVRCPDCNTLLNFLSNMENFHSHLICLDQRGSASRTPSRWKKLDMNF